MRITTLTLLAGVLLGLTGGAAMATGGGNSCDKKPWLPECIQSANPNLSIAEATAIAAQLQAQMQEQLQSQGQSQSLTNDIDMGDTYVSPGINGGPSHYCVSSPWFGICVPMKIDRIAKRAEVADKCQVMPEGSTRKAVCIAVTDDSPPLQTANREVGVYDVSFGEDKRAKAAIKKGEWATIRLGTFRCVDYRAEFKGVASAKLAHYADRVCAG